MVLLVLLELLILLGFALRISFYFLASKADPAPGDQTDDLTCRQPLMILYIQLLLNQAQVDNSSSQKDSSLKIKLFSPLSAYLNDVLVAR